jgi:hypothetical protein
MTTKKDISDARRLWDERGWDYATLGCDPGTGSDECFVWIYDFAGQIAWSGSHAEFVAWSERMRAHDGERMMAAVRDIAEGL